MAGGRFEVALQPIRASMRARAGGGRVPGRRPPGLPPGPLAKVASGGELSRISLAIQVIASKVSLVPDADLRRSGRRHRRQRGGDRRSAAQAARRRAPGAVRHPPAAGGGAGRPALAGEQGRPQRQRGEQHPGAGAGGANRRDRPHAGRGGDHRHHPQARGGDARDLTKAAVSQRRQSGEPVAEQVGEHGHQRQHVKVGAHQVAYRAVRRF